MVGYADWEALNNNCREVFGQNSSVQQPYDGGQNFRCITPTYDARYPFNIGPEYNKQVLCQRMASRNFSWIAQSRNLRGASNLGGYYDQSNDSCQLKVRSLQ